MRHFSASVWLLVITYALMHSGGSLMILIAGLIGATLAPSIGQATLPVALMIIGVACSTIPLGKLQTRFGRKPVFLVFSVLAMLSALSAYFSLIISSFLLFCGSAFSLGFSMASAHQYRFAVTEHVSKDNIPVVTSTLLFGGLISAFIGPEIALAGQSVSSVEFAGSFLLLAALFLLCFVLLLFVGPGQHEKIDTVDDLPHQSGFTLILKSPILLLSLLSGVVGFSVMSFIMTATPLTMHEHAGHNLADTKFVIQSHIAAMYLPSLISGILIKRLGFKLILWAGLVIYAICLAIAFFDNSFLHFWLALVLLGLGWNFLFITSTSMLSLGHTHEQRFSVQSTNDFIIFSCQSIAALTSGWFLFHWQWQGVLFITLPILLLFSIFLFRSQAFAQLNQNND